MSRYDDPHYGTGSRSAAEFAALQARNAAARPEPIEDAILAALAPVNPDTGDDDARFTVQDKGGADWVARLVAKARREFDNDEALFHSEMAPINKEIGRLQDWLDGRRKAKEAVEARWLPQLTEWHASQREVVTSAKGKETVVNASIELPSGAVLRSKRQPPSVEVSDFDAFDAWVAANLPDDKTIITVIPQHVVLEERKANLAAIRSAFVAKVDEGDTGPLVLDGERVPGVWAERAPTKYSLETPKADQ